MNRAISVIVFAVIIVTIVGLVVMFAGNNSQTSVVKTNTSTNTGSTGQNTGTTGTTGTSGTGSTGTTTGKITLTELANHNKQSDCWVVYQNKVYDLTSWLPRHPGSPAAILPYCGNTGFEPAFTNMHGTSQVQRLMKEGVYKGDFA